MPARTVLTLLAATVFLGAASAVSTAFGQAAARSGVADVESASSKVIDGVTFYYDADGTLVYKDDPVHYNPPRRFYYRNGGWVMARSSTGHNHSRYANTGLHKRRGQGAQVGSANLRDGQARGAAGTTKTVQRETAGDSRQTVTGVRAGQGAQGGSAPQGRKAESRSTARATKAVQGGSVGTAGQTTNGASAGKRGNSGSSVSRGAAAGSSGGKQGGGNKAASSGGASRGRRGPK